MFELVECMDGEFDLVDPAGNILFPAETTLNGCISYAKTLGAIEAVLHMNGKRLGVLAFETE